MTEASRQLRQLAQELVAVHQALPELRAALLTGSSALGISDFYSDIDLILYYESLPETLPLIARIPPVWEVGSTESGARMMAHKIGGVECQLVHVTLEAIDAQFRAVHEELEVTSPTQKALSGILEGLALFGEPLVRELKARATVYPDALRQKMIETHLSFFPIWNTDGWLVARDCALWQAELRFTAGKNLLGILCGLNRVYFTSFQLKHTRHLCAKLTLSPENLAARLDQALAGDYPVLQALVEETLALVETHAPGIDTSTVRRQLARIWQPWGPHPSLGQ